MKEVATESMIIYVCLDALCTKSNQLIDYRQQVTNKKIVLRVISFQTYQQKGGNRGAHAQRASIPLQKKGSL
jgi:hypothetical protein